MHSSVIKTYREIGRHEHLYDKQVKEEYGPVADAKRANIVRMWASIHCSKP